MSTKDIYIGLMSGTSLDSIDAVAAVFSPDFRLLATHTEIIPTELKGQISALMLPGENEIDRLGEIDIALGSLFAKAVNTLITQHNLDRSTIRAIGSHGQTVRHRPNKGFTLQIGDPNVIAEQTGITTIADFRRRDMAASGEGAPLAPAFHNAMLRHDVDRVILNIGGMANITHLPADRSQPVSGFDTGPGNVLMNAWIQKHQNTEFDRDGNWAADGTPNPELLNRLLNLEFFKQSPPKSTGREQFNLAWLESILGDLPPLNAVDVQSTLATLTAQTIADSLNTHLPCQSFELYVCGGGSHNRYLMRLLENTLPNAQVYTTDDAGIDADWMEACAFAWLAQQCLEGSSGNIESVTGAKGPRVLGAIYQA